MLLKGSKRIELPAGKRVSFFPVGRMPCRMRTGGLKWPLDRLEWRIGDFGISNVTVERYIDIEVLQGRLIMMYDLGHEDRA